ncbi:aminomethyl-transferring glycine dehydrogenase [Marinoscillum furvescens]|uniref:Glycine dehydrogenase (decarboxylating) n=1 Tax=Marinoscillum furvescens DSM 4134 TaxID=1122208 RepID=A0A3D9L6I0_MARFU|nr:aminomethyl-transferring glycine dehydrogenase [Marinoscillum furvescens]REE01734.1 glycine dehydrogenase (decarboxylating) [Marinoscillum furvescens DSM 4134]
MTVDLNERVAFETRHNGPTPSEESEMMRALNVASLDELIDQTIPQKIRLQNPLKLSEPLNEYEYLNKLKLTASKNKVFKSYIGQGYYNCVVPTVIQRNILENPGWYTAYTPYQAEIAQGRLEALINFQTLVIDLTGMEIANASLLDEGTAAAEAVSMLHATRPRDKKKAQKFIVDERTFPQTLEVLKTRTTPLGIDLVVADINTIDLSDPELFGVFFQYPDNFGEVTDRAAFVAAAKENNVSIAVASDLLSLCLLTPPGEWGADVVVGTAQRFGVPMGYGGPHAGFFATLEANKRHIPGRIIGVSKDAEGQPAYRMALQTREQHIKRERATSNICTAQVLLAVMSSMYAVYHGPEGLKRIASRVHGLAQTTVRSLDKLGLTNKNETYFDTLRFALSANQKEAVKAASEAKGVNFRYIENEVLISFDETHQPVDAQEVVDIFSSALQQDTEAIFTTVEINFPEGLARTSAFLEHDVFQIYQSEHEILRYMKRLENKDLSLAHSMISLGSCTMKLNATTEMIPVTWPEFGSIHPFAPASQTEGYKELIDELHDWLAEITGFAAVSFQPNSGAQGEFAGLMAIRSYHQANGDHHRNITLIPSSAHGTNPASAVMAGMKVVIVKCDDHGNIDVDDLKAKAEQHSENLSALMVTYPSTHGVFEESIMEICAVIHQHGGQVYMDGANMNAQVGLTSPAMIGADVCHLNLHKTFCIPHGGGGPGMGPIGVAEHLAPYLPGSHHEGVDDVNVSSAPYGSASILPISHAYIAMMGASGLKKATEVAILNANYIGHRLKEHFPILYANEKGRNAHELIIDCRGFKQYGVEVEDIAKRLMDYGYHAPTVSFPVPGTMMIEPTESETKAEIDRFCDVMVSIREEIEEVISGQADKENNVLKNAPHTYRTVIAEEWSYPYTREKAAFPLAELKHNKFWPSVSRIDSAFGDRNLMCSCAPVEEYMETGELVS